MRNVGKPMDMHRYIYRQTPRQMHAHEPIHIETHKPGVNRKVGYFASTFAQRDNFKEGSGNYTVRNNICGTIFITSNVIIVDTTYLI